MRKIVILTIFYILVGSCLYSQNEKLKTVTTVGIFDTLEAKSGFRINEYYVELTPVQFDSLKGKKVSVTGKLIIVEAINLNSKVIEQGSLNDRYFIIEPSFTIVYDAREPLIRDSESY